MFQLSLLVTRGRVQNGLNLNLNRGDHNPGGHMAANTVTKSRMLQAGTYYIAGAKDASYVIH